MNHEYIRKSNLVDQYVLGKLAAPEAEEFENHFIDCPECVEQLNLTRNFVHDLKGLAVQETLVSRTQPRRWRLPQLVPVRAWALAVTCGLLVAMVLAFVAFRRMRQLEAELGQAKVDASTTSQQYERRLETAAESARQQQLTQQELAQKINELEQKLKTEEANDVVSIGGSEALEVNFPIFALVAGPRGKAPAPVEIAPPASSARFALSIPVEDRRDFSVYRVTIVNQRGKRVWQGSGFRPDEYHALSLSLKSNFLARGTYDLRVEGLTPPSNWETIGSYPFRIVRSR